MKTTIEKRIVLRNEQEPSNSKQDFDSTIFWNYHMLTLVIGSILLTFLVVTLAMVYWYSKQQRGWKMKALPSELPTHSTNVEKIEKLKDIPLFALVTERIQLTDDDINASFSMMGVQQSRKKNLLERRGSNTSLKLSITTKHRPINSPLIDHSSDEYLQTATRKLSIDELHQDAQNMILLSHEFWTIPTNHLEKLRICGAGSKNRYGTIIANEHSRVQLPELSDDPATSYINANYVRGWPNEHNTYIATQGPLENTIVDFYRMIWQENVPVIVMITRLFERNKSKCERYIPDDGEHQYGDFHVQIKSTSYETDYEIRRLIIEFDDQQREIDHYWYIAWPDQSCPDVAQPLIELVHRVETSRIELTTLNHKLGPVIVHCSAGIGRTGCLIALSNGIKQLDQEHEIDVVRILCNLRQDRGGMIQTNDQYQFVYQALSEYARTLSSG